MSYSDEETNRRLAKLEKKLSKLYKQCYKELDQSYKQYLYGYNEIVDGEKVHHAGYYERWQKEYEEYQAGKYTDQQWKDWQLAQIGRADRWKQLRDDMAERIKDTNIIASAYINDDTPGIYSLNYNFEAFEIERNTGIVFNIYDEDTVKLLVEEENHVEFRTVKVNPERDYEWNRAKIDQALVSGIMQGKSIDRITDNFMQVMKSNEAAARRNARTAYTSAQNGGRQESYNKAVELGIEIQKEWMATLDDRTRDSHQSLDGERVDYNQLFSNKCEYPGDPKGKPAEVYNCRCTMRAILPGYNDRRNLDRAYKIDGHRQFDKSDKAMTNKNMTYKGLDNTTAYKEWLKAKNKAKGRK